MATDWTKKREELISKLPTLLDILDRYTVGEEWWALEKGALAEFMMPHHDQDGLFDAVMMPSGYVKLFPVGLCWNCYYRGQSSYYPDSKPSLWRKGTRKKKGMQPEDQFLERLKLCELKLMIDDYPLTHIFRNGIYYKSRSGEMVSLPLDVDAEALAQHYGIKTELTDLTTDLWVAAFFAATKYDWKTDTYTAITDIKKYEYGVFYHYFDPTVPLPGDKKEPDLRAVGMQPFGRPGNQAGYVLKMKPNENMNRMAGFEKIKFRHVAEINKLIYNYSNCSRNFFPEELFQKKLLALRNEENRFSKVALEMAKEKYLKGYTDAQVDKFLDSKNIQLQDKPLYLFSEQEKKHAIAYWTKHEREYLDKILIREVFTGPITIEDDAKVEG